MAGAGKLVYNHYQLRKYTAIAAKKKEEAQEMHRTPSVKKERGPEIPFGVRAIESGIEVDGVWISRSNTPAPSSRASPVASPIIEPQGVRESVPSHTTFTHISQMAMPQPVYTHRRADGSQSSFDTRSLDSPFERATSAERLPSRNNSPPDPVPRVSHSHRPRQSSHLRFSDGERLSGHSHTNSKNVHSGSSKSSDGMLSLSALSSVHPLKLLVLIVWQITDGRSLRKTGSTSSEEEFPNHYIPRRLDANNFTRYDVSSPGETEEWPLSYTKEPFDYLRGRREIHAAETGQLLPRHRSTDASGDWTSKRLHSSDRSIPLGHVYSSDPSPPQGPFTTPPETPLQHSDSIDTPSFKSFLESDPAHSKHRSTPFVDRHISESQDGLWPMEDIHASSHLQPAKAVRKVNSGFEVLRPGTLLVPRQPNDFFAGKPNQENGSKRPPKRLHKKNQSGSKSESSSPAVEEV